MSEPPSIRIDLHDRHLVELTAWFGHDGYLLLMDGKQTMAGNDEESMRYVMDRFIKMIRESAAYLLKPKEEWE